MHITKTEESYTFSDAHLAPLLNFCDGVNKKFQI